jgi:hypothetical protein
VADSSRASYPCAAAHHDGVQRLGEGLQVGARVHAGRDTRLRHGHRAGVAIGKGSDGGEHLCCEICAKDRGMSGALQRDKRAPIIKLFPHLNERTASRLPPRSRRSMFDRKQPSSHTSDTLTRCVWACRSVCGKQRSQHPGYIRQGVPKWRSGGQPLCSSSKYPPDSALWQAPRGTPHGTLPQARTIIK